ncbi:acetate kinase [Weissella oryzae SG25]|uniref:Acetate kinase n=1 Tax=Weissella oryzae (strain DSM 25784 / JCM 18191 / LMG 30913 / SG25) TaxID=1329250 RepID=A0A069CTC3_WEIOS|nr:acetate kinase [Weissella oryzae]GAK30657.1 acetate kinase [Weissella oryzae SG25]
MAMIMAVNAGSSSLKFQLIEMPAEKVIAKGQVERIGLTDSIFTLKFNGEKVELIQDINDHEQAINLLLNQLQEHNLIEQFNDIKGVGHRVVAGGEWFNKSHIIDEDALEKIERLASYAPLHNPANAMGIRVFQELLPDAVSVAVFDTAFHQTLTRDKYLYALPYEYYTKYGARKYGMHGTSHRYVAHRGAEVMGRDLKDLKMITLHLGAGASVTAIKDGVSFDTSMGFTPLAGLMMATRTGDVDPSLVYYIQEREGLTNEQMLNVLNKKSGLLGISTISSDMRDLQDVEATNEHAALAMKMFVNRVVRYVGEYTAEMGGLDALVFTAGIGENSSIIRERVLEQLAYMGITFDPEVNKRRDDEMIISNPDSKVTVMKIATNEELMIARDVQELMNEQ